MAAGKSRTKSTSVSTYLRSPIGYLRITGNDKWLQAVAFCDQPGMQADAVPDILKRACQQLDEYFKGQRRKFELPLSLRGTSFQKKVWAALRKVPFGRTLSYGGVARAIGRPYSGRAVGGANHHNPVAIIVPCHRIIGHNGRLTGYGGGLWRKQWLLDHEKKVSGR
ncbi:MAG: methylated-DNA--[protein]-cysteine S-methyltransferase [Candidatus Aminicenantes bacterium]|nr:methylated-DNA--[protein]-cysteine S-methyltransferase [Candidatus Aminicenantes bacterium]